IGVFVRAAAIVVLVMVRPKISLTDVLVVDLVSTSACVVLSWSSIAATMRALHTPTATGTLPLREMFRFTWHMALVGPMSGTTNPGAIRLALASGLGVAQSGMYAFLQSL